MMTKQPNLGEGNENWEKCPKCASPVMIDPETGHAEVCSRCKSLASPTVGWLGGYFIFFVVAGIIALVCYCIHLLFST
jgi:hypothetical protein|tara:strand:- start:570 stop:803 length:234 start_codon:yes stop_codon:yes gene_type:complete